MIYKKGQELELTIEGLAYGGRGIARQNNFVFFVEAAIPGQKVLVYISRKRKDFAEARIIDKPQLRIVVLMFRTSLCYRIFVTII